MMEKNLPPSPKQTFIFDFDGTLADTTALWLPVFNRFAKEMGFLPVTPENLPRLKKLGTKEVLRELRLPLWKLPFILAKGRKEIKRAMPQIQAFPGWQDALIPIHEAGHTLGIVTSNSKENVESFLKLHGLEYFDFILTIKSLWGKKRPLKKLMRRYSLSPETVFYIGDETRDIEAAKIVGISMIAVSWGFFPKETLLAHHPDYCLDSPSDLLSIPPLKQP